MGAIMVETFCCRVHSRLEVVDTGHEGNILQAILLKASTTVEYLLFVLQGTAVVAGLLGVVDALHSEVSLMGLLPGALLVVAIVYMLFFAAHVSDSCSRVPRLINSLSFGEGTEDARKDVVEYILHSQAGFYVFNVRITTSMALKFTYLWGVVVFGLATKATLIPVL